MTAHDPVLAARAADGLRDAAALLIAHMTGDSEGCQAIISSQQEGDGGALLLGMVNIAASTLRSFAGATGVPESVAAAMMQAGCREMGTIIEHHGVPDPGVTYSADTSPDDVRDPFIAPDDQIGGAW